jgi:hypothetical protein
MSRTKKRGDKKQKAMEDLAPKSDPKGGLNFAADGSVRLGDVNGLPAVQDVAKKIELNFGK